MAAEKKTIRALGLCSGGLDSILSALVLREQGIDVHWVTFETPFFSSAKAKKASQHTGIPLMVRKITPVYMEMMRSPSVKYGKNMNPCMDCHSLMFRLAGEIMTEQGFDFLFSGEVLGQRPMSQTRTSLRYVEKHSGYEGSILRPLSAKNLPETLPEKDGLVDREQLLDISGRSRKPQLQLAKKFGVTDFPAPAGGCLLTDKLFSRRLKDLFDHQTSYPEKDLNLLKFGRHMRLDSKIKIVVGRTHQDNEQINHCIDPQTDMVLKMDDFPGPLVVISGGGSESMVMLAAGICAGYSKAPEFEPVAVNVQEGGRRRQVMVLAIPPVENKKFLI
ncbi:tRNA 4-thiouridine(8) synthase ThiI [Desulfosarcina sp.]|uniref:tRNA 4-thiouridine(8) synthase ThiI n=1 Tax=Desulfosarcina sp. TaxID=2027861 RepID=UPI0029B37B0A|nr:tRNA 4-thiouridine(8) synthase ThiI [Desulfosarcina sp.]MDX2452926.1 tRNA 4-thiouridine(8) synthase ThiI [Desulfosarcina sp.]MDX2490660.1 tRNA 4-thiouridine(8) synthase ThiI [Desulfosarcina sp.]